MANWLAAMASQRLPLPRRLCLLQVLFAVVQGAEATVGHAKCQGMETCTNVWNAVEGRSPAVAMLQSKSDARLKEEEFRGAASAHGAETQRAAAQKAFAQEEVAAGAAHLIHEAVAAGQRSALQRQREKALLKARQQSKEYTNHNLLLQRTIAELNKSYPKTNADIENKIAGYINYQAASQDKCPTYVKEAKRRYNEVHAVVVELVEEIDYIEKTLVPYTFEVERYYTEIKDCQQRQDLEINKCQKQKEYNKKVCADLKAELYEMQTMANYDHTTQYGATTKPGATPTQTVVYPQGYSSTGYEATAATGYKSTGYGGHVSSSGYGTVSYPQGYSSTGYEATAATGYKSAGYGGYSSTGYEATAATGSKSAGYGGYASVSYPNNPQAGYGSVPYPSGWGYKPNASLLQAAVSASPQHMPKNKPQEDVSGARQLVQETRSLAVSLAKCMAEEGSLKQGTNLLETEIYPPTKYAQQPAASHGYGSGSIPGYQSVQPAQQPAASHGYGSGSIPGYQSLQPAASRTPKVSYAHCNYQMHLLQIAYSKAYLEMVHQIGSYEQEINSKACEEYVQSEEGANMKEYETKIEKLTVTIYQYQEKLVTKKTRIKQAYKAEADLRHQVDQLSKECRNVDATIWSLDKVHDAIHVMGMCPSIGQQKFHIPKCAGNFIDFYMHGGDVDSEMNAKCKEYCAQSRDGAECHAADCSEIEIKAIDGMPEYNTAQYPLVCGGAGSEGDADSYRRCWDPGANLEPYSARTDCSYGRKAISCVIDAYGEKHYK